MTATARRQCAESRLRAERATSNISPRSSKWFGMRRGEPKKGPQSAWCTGWQHRGPKIFLRGNFAMQSNIQNGLHVAIIMDGNGRWATRRGLPRVAGHRAGVAAVRSVVDRAPALGIGRLTLYAFSSDNWRRPAEEVESIFCLLRAYLRLETKRLRQHGARLEFIGRRDRLPSLVVREIAQAEDATAAGRRLHLRLAVDYSSRDAITRAAAGVSSAHFRDLPPSVDLLGRELARALTAES